MVRAPLKLEAPHVNHAFLCMPDPAGFGDHIESGQIVPVSFGGRKGSCPICMFLHDHPPIAGDASSGAFPGSQPCPPGPHVDPDPIVL